MRRRTNPARWLLDNPLWLVLTWGMGSGLAFGAALVPWREGGVAGVAVAMACVFVGGTLCWSAVDVVRRRIR